MNDFDIPIFKKTYDLYRSFYALRLSVPKQDRYALWQRCENCMLDFLESILLASQTARSDKLPLLEQGSAKLNLLRVFIRLAKDVKAIQMKHYVALEERVDEIGRMLGGWIKSLKDR